jgi:hypothetical protein
MTGIKSPQGSSDDIAAEGNWLASPWKQGTRALRRYLLLSTGISSTALGLALIVSFVAASYGESSAEELAGVRVSQIHGRHYASALDSTLGVIAAEMAPSTAMLTPAELAPPLDVERREAEEDASVTNEPEAPETLAAPPPAAPLDFEWTRPRPPLDAAAAALPVPLLAQDLEEEEHAEPLESVIAPPGGLPRGGAIYQVNVTFYDCVNQGFCGAMYNGQQVYEGAAACSWDLPLGTTFVIQNDPTGRTYVCADRGLLPDTWVDIYFYHPSDGWAWQQVVGRYATLDILSVPFP